MSNPKKINLNTWPRRETYEFFKEFPSPHFNITASVNITQTFKFFETHQISKYNGMLWLISTAANAVEELKTRIRQDQVVLHDRVDPAFTMLSDDNTLAFCTSEYTKDIKTFFNRVEKDMAAVKANPKMEDEPGKDNVLFISCLPWINFSSISHPMSHDETDCIPRISWGKFTHTPDQITMPVSLQVHHSLADGYHTGLFYEKLESLLANPKDINWPISG